jgi:hypothetical protein
MSVTASAPPPAESQANTGTNLKLSTDAGPSSRRAWITDWLKDHSDQGRPCSAKAAYRLADSTLHTSIFFVALSRRLPCDLELGLGELKSRAAEVWIFQHGKVHQLIRGGC